MINIKLSTQTIRELFPEGSSARVQLQHSGIDNIVKEMFIKDTNNRLKKKINEEFSSFEYSIPNVNDEIKNQLEKIFITKGWNKVECSSAFNSKIENEVKRVAENAINKTITEYIERAVENAKKRIELQLSSSIEQMERNVVTHINDNFHSVINKAIKNKLKEAFPE